MASDKEVRFLLDAKDERIAKAAEENAMLRAKLAEYETGRERVSAAELSRKGGVWLGAARSWLQWHKRNGSDVTWGSNDELQPPITAREVDEIAADVAAAAMVPQPTEVRLGCALRARWTAESERDRALGELAIARNERDAVQDKLARMTALFYEENADHEKTALLAETAAVQERTRIITILRTKYALNRHAQEFAQALEEGTL